MPAASTSQASDGVRLPSERCDRKGVFVTTTPSPNRSAARRHRRRRSAVSYRALTKCETSPPSCPISLTKREEMNWKRSEAMRKTVSTAGLRRLFMPAI